MGVEASLLELLAPLKIGEPLVPGVVLAGASDEAGPRLTFDVEGQPLAVEVAPADAETPAAATSPRLRFTYIASGDRARAAGLRVCRALAERAAVNEGHVLQSLADEASADPGGDTRVREVRVVKVLEDAWAGGRRFHTLTPYVGCLIGCRFCYAQSHVAASRRLAGRAAVPWGSYVDVRVNAPEVLAEELARMPVRLVKLCPIVSDPYQAVEARHRVTRRCLEVLASAARPPVTLVLTRSRLVERDAELLGAMRAHVGVSLPTIDESARSHFEPRAASIPERLATLRALRAAGAITAAVVQPILPGSIDDLAQAIADTCSSASIDVLQGLEGAGEDFADPRFAHAASPEWQLARAKELYGALRLRGVPVWRELPPGVD
jgi:DNA repair photolyase